MAVVEGTSLTPEQWDERIPPLVEVREKASGVFESIAKDHFVPVMGRSIFGGSLIAQVILAASRTVGSEMRLHGSFIDRADVHEHIEYHVEILRDGRSYASRRVDAKQGDKLLFFAMLSFHVLEPNQPEFFLPSPKVVSRDQFTDQTTYLDDPYRALSQVVKPEECDLFHTRFREWLKTAPKDHPAYPGRALWTDIHTNVFPMQSRVAYPGMLNEKGYARYQGKPAYWLSCRGYCRGPQNFQRAMLGFHIDQLLLVSMAGSMTKPIIKMMASLDHTMWFYNDFEMSDWLLLVLENQALGNGRALVVGRVYRRDGLLVAVSVRFIFTDHESQEGVFRSTEQPKAQL